MKKKILFALIISAILVCLFTIGVNAVVIDGLDYTLTDSTSYEGYDGKATLNTGNKTEATGDVVIPESVTNDGKTYIVKDIASSAFENNKNVTSLTIPASVTSFGNSSFNGMNITKTNFLGTVAQWCEISTGTYTWTALSPTAISKNLYIQGELVTDLVIPEGTTKINYCLFKNCVDIVSVALPTTLTTVQTDAFAGCSNIKTVVYSGTLAQWATNISFSASSSNPMYYAGNVKTSDYDMVPANLVIVDGTTKINNYVFSGCKSLVTVEMPNTITSVGNGVFYACSALTNAKLSTSLKSIGNDFFRECISLVNVDNTENLTSVAQYSFHNCIALKGFNGENGIRFGEKFTSVGNLSFVNCDSITYVVFPATLTYVGQAAFSYCNKLQLVSFDAVNAKIANAIANGEKYTAVSFNNCGNFKGCSSLVAMSLPEGTTYITNRFVAEGCTSLTAFYMPNSIVEIGSNGGGSGAFCNATNMYFVQESFTVSQCIVNGSVDLSKLVLPEKPSVYYMPTSFTQFGGHVESNSSKSGTIFQNCTSLNDTIVFGENFVYFNANNAFCNVGTEASPKNIVFTANMTRFVTPQNAKYLSFIFVNKEDTSPADIGITHVYKNNNNAESYFYFCFDGSKYNYSTETAEITNADSIASYVSAMAKTSEAKHVRNLKFDVPTLPTCTVAGYIDTYCFCDLNKENKLEPVVLPATGHDSKGATEPIGWIYENNNYFQNAKYKHVCADCTVEYAGAVIDDTALFNKGKGYSVPEEGTLDSISHTIMVNKDNVLKYQTATGNVVNYGVVAAVGDSLGTPIKVENGEIKRNGEQALLGDMTGTKYEKLVVRISNVPENTEVNCNAYVVFNKQDIYYLCGGEVTTTAVAKTL